MINIAEIVRDPACTSCKLHDGAQAVCVVGRGNPRAKIMVVGKNPDSKKFRGELEAYLTEVGLNPDNLYFTYAVKCRNFDKDVSNADVKKCKMYLDHEIELVKPKWILALGGEALLATAGKSGILKYRGKILERDGIKIFPTISPSMVTRNPGYRQGFVADLHFFKAQTEGRSTGVDDPVVATIDTTKKVKSLIRLLQAADEIAYDVETTGRGEWMPNARIVSLSITIHTTLISGAEKLVTCFIPLYHPESPWRTKWRSLISQLVPWMMRVRWRDAHNGKYDDKWLAQFSGHSIHCNFDTLLAAHVLDENRPKGLKPLAQSLLGVAPWAIETKDLLNTPLSEIRDYNTKDTHYTYHLRRPLADELKKQPRLARIFQVLMMPSSKTYTKSERHGVWLDRELLATNTKIAYDMRADVDSRLMEFVPKGTDDELRELGWPTMGKKGKLAEVNFNASKWARWFLFDYLDLPVLETGKEKADGSEGDPSMREGVLMELKGLHPAVPIMLERVEWQKMCSSFFDPYNEQIGDDDRIHTVFKLHGTVTGRTSSGKEDQEKITASRGKRHGMNLQQVPRNPLVRGVIGAPPDWFIVESDFSQIELRIAAFIARAKSMIRLYQQGADIHLFTASRVTGIPESQVPKEIRKKVGKPVNFGFLYGMGWRKFIQTAFENYGAVFDEAEARAYREAYFQLFPELIEWHHRQRRLVRKYGRVESPLGRVRHLPDIYSPVEGIQHEAERQAINSPVQSMASDMTLLSMNLLDVRLEKLRMPAKIIGTVHDAMLVEAHSSCLTDLLPLIKTTMEDLPLEKYFGLTLDVPIEADLKVGKHWGTATELTADQVFNWDPSILAA